MAKVITFNLEPQDLSIIEQHNVELASPGRSAALRHILREWARANSLNGPFTVIPATAAIPSEGQYTNPSDVNVIRDTPTGKTAVIPESMLEPEYFGPDTERE